MGSSVEIYRVVATQMKLYVIDLKLVLFDIKLLPKEDKILHILNV